MKKLIFVLVFFLMPMSLMAQSEENGSLRFFHAVPGVGAVDIYTNGQLSVTNLDFGEASTYIQAPAGEHQVAVHLAGDANAVWEQSVIVDAQIPRTLIASNPNAPQFDAYDDDFTPLGLGTSRLRVIHAISDGPGVTVEANGQQIADGLEYGGTIGTFDIPADIYSVTVTAGDTSILEDAPVNLVTNTTHQLVLYGTAAEPQYTRLAARTNPTNDSEGLVRVVHTIVGAPAVDVYINDTLAIPALAFGDVTEHLALPSGEHTVELRVSGETTSILSGSLSVESGIAVTVPVLGTADDPGIEIFTDDIADSSPDTVLLSVMNAIPADTSITIELADGTILAQELAYGSISDVVSIDPTVAGLTFTISVDGTTATLAQDTVTLYGGVYYNVIALSGSAILPPSLQFAATSLTQDITSAPAIAEPEAVVEVEEEAPVTEPEEVVAQPTLPPVETAVPATPLPAPTIVPQTTPEPEFPQGRIVLDPGANLQLRQRPSSSAFSLGLAPSGAVVSVLGRQGAPVDINGVELPVVNEAGEEVPFVDPATLLPDDDADLDATNLWVYISYPTPDGGEITAWTVAQYLDIVTPDGEAQRLADLPLIPASRIGEALNTDVTPPSEADNRVTVRVINLDPTANLNMRRTADTAGEILARVPAGTVLEVQGRTEDAEWVFASFAPPEGGEITGWLSSQYLQYELNGEIVTLEELESDAPLSIFDGIEQRGEIGANAPGIAQPTVDPQRDAFIATVLLDPGANLNLRRTPDVNAEVLAQIPSGTTLIIMGKTADDEWFETSFEGASGWVAVSFVSRVTFNGNAADLNEIPVTFDS